MTKDYLNISIGIGSPALYNLFVIFVCTVLSLWTIRASKRLYRVLRVRAAILTGRLVHIWAISSSLPYFEGAIQPHIDAIVHTRQSYPPTNVKCLYVPFFVEEISVKTNDNNILEFALSITTTVPCRLWIVQNISLYLLQKSFIAYKNADSIFFNNYSNDYNDIESEQLLQIYRENHSNRYKIYHTGVGLCKIVVTAQNNDESNKNSDSKVVLFIQPLTQNKQMFTQNTISNNKNIEILNALHLPLSNGEIELNSFSVGDILSNHKPVIKQLLDFGIKVISSDNNNLSSGSNTVSTPSTDELFLYCNDNNIYSAMEVFGLNQGINNHNSYKDTANNKYIPVLSPVDTSSDSNEDCVVCLSESQQVLLLPCRHMCICRQCLSRIDKCPICRQTYSEHMALVINDEKKKSDRTQNIVTI